MHYDDILIRWKAFIVQCTDAYAALLPKSVSLTRTAVHRMAARRAPFGGASRNPGRAETGGDIRRPEVGRLDVLQRSDIALAYWIERRRRFGDP
ncbi:hypothetical protein FHS25_007077 [Rhizobium laguerreae]|uniref:Uncharacterized protein n=1 Tax=Rhizobium laguerreae TaxID=1076926 RepID=A0ABR6GK10_9HYPH|nr:hypothetical protein [Rhizobium laguerreae]